MALNMMTVTTEIEGLADRFTGDLKEVGSKLGSAIQSRIKSGKSGSIEKDIRTAIRNLPDEYKAEVLIAALVSVANANENDDDDYDMRSPSKKRVGSNW